MTQRTLSIIKPDANAKNVVGPIIARFESRSSICAVERSTCPNVKRKVSMQLMRAPILW